MAIKGTGKHRVEFIGTARFVGIFGYCRPGDILMMDDGDWPRLKISAQFREAAPISSPMNKKQKVAETK